MFQSNLEVIKLIENRSLRRRLYLNNDAFFLHCLKNVNAPNSPLSKEARIEYLNQLAKHPFLNRFLISSGLKSEIRCYSSSIVRFNGDNLA